MKTTLLLTILAFAATAAQAQSSRDICAPYTSLEQPVTTLRFLDKDSTLRIIKTVVTKTDVQIWQDEQLVKTYPVSDVDLSKGKIYALPAKLDGGELVPVIGQGFNCLFAFLSALKSDYWKPIRIINLDHMVLRFEEVAW